MSCLTFLLQVSFEELKVYLHAEAHKLMDRKFQETLESEEDPVWSV